MDLELYFQSRFNEILTSALQVGADSETASSLAKKVALFDTKAQIDSAKYMTESITEVDYSPLNILAEKYNVNNYEPIVYGDLNTALSSVEKQIDNIVRPRQDVGGVGGLFNQISQAPQGIFDRASDLASNKGIQTVAAAAITGGMMNGGLSSFGLGETAAGAGGMMSPHSATLLAQEAAQLGYSQAAIQQGLIANGVSSAAASQMAWAAANGLPLADIAAVAEGAASGGGLMDTLTKAAGNKLQDPTTWGGVLNNLANVAGGAYLANESSSLFGDLAKQSIALGQDYANKIGAAGADAASKAQFKPYTVTSGLGGTSVTPEGLSYNLSPQQQAITDSLMSQAQSMASKDAYVSPEGLFSTLQAMSDPVNARKRLELENRLSAQGRLGTATAAYGGTPEQLAMEIAMQEQLAKNAWQSQIGAGQLTGQNLTNQGAALGTAYKPYDQMQGMMSQALQGQQLAQNVGNTQAEIAYKTALAQAMAALEGQKTAMGYNTMGSMQNLGMMQGLIGQGANGTNNLVNTASGLFDLGKKVYSLF